MNAEHQALAEYLEAHIDKRFDQISGQLVSINNKFKPVGKQLGYTHRKLRDIERDLKSLINQVDGKNDQRDELIEDYELRISVLEHDNLIMNP